MVSVVVCASISDAPHQRRETLENVLIKVGVARILGDRVKNSDEALEDLLVHRCQRLTCRHDDTHRAWCICYHQQRNKEQDYKDTFHEMVIFGDFFRRPRAFDLFQHRIQKLGRKVMHVRLREPMKA